METQTIAITKFPSVQLEKNLNSDLYNGTTRYMLPVDLGERNRLNLQHELLKYGFNGNFKAPVEESLKKGIKVLDVGCGTGVWTLDMAKTYLNSTFYATDLHSTNFPPVMSIPTNCSFVTANTTEDGLPFPDNTFDFVYQRFMVLAFSRTQWLRAISELIRVAKPGAWIELVETQAQPKILSLKGAQFWAKFHDNVFARSIDLSLIPCLGQLLSNAGLSHVCTSHVGFPVGWGGPDGRGPAGDLMAQNLQCQYRVFRPYLKDMDDATYEQFVDDILEEHRQDHTWIDYLFVYGRKKIAERAKL